MSQAATPMLLQAAVEAGGRGDARTTTVIVRGLLAVHRRDHEVALGCAFALLIAGRYRMAAHLLRFVLAHGPRHGETADQLMNWAARLSRRNEGSSHD